MGDSRGLLCGFIRYNILKVAAVAVFWSRKKKSIRYTMEKISWEPVQDRHCRGRCELGNLWIRLDRAGKVSGIYTQFGETQKWCPESEEEETLAGAKIICELLLAGETAARKIEQIIS